MYIFRVAPRFGSAVEFEFSNLPGGKISIGL